MIEKKLQLILTFDKTIDAMTFENYCLKNKVNGRLIPIPGEISSGCGLCWKTNIDEKDNIIIILRKINIEKYNFYEMVI